MDVGLLMLAGGVAAGAFGSLLGVGGGLLIVPLLTFGFGLPLREAVGVSLVCVIVTSSAAAGTYLRRGVADLRLGMILELFTAFGALVGGIVAFLLDERVIAGLFAVVLTYFALMMARAAHMAGDGTGLRRPAPQVEPGPRGEEVVDEPALPPHADPDEAGSGVAPVSRNRLFAGLGSIGAGIVSALLGVGGGIVMVPLMHIGLKVPLRVATATSNVMIGVTASTSALVYLLRGGIDALAVGPTAIGVFVGATVASRLANRLDLRMLRLLFVLLLLYTAFQMARRATGL